MTCAGCPKRSKSPISAHSPAAVSVSIPRRHINRLAVCAHGDAAALARSRPRAARGGSSARRPRRDSPPSAALRCRLREAHAGQPAADAPGSSCACGPSKRTSWRNSSLASAMARAHQIAAQILARAHQVAQRLRLDARDRDAMQLAGRPAAAPAARRRADRSSRDPSARAGSTPARTPSSRRPPPPAGAPARTRSARPHTSRAPDPATRPRTPPPPRCAPATAAPAARPSRDPTSPRPTPLTCTSKATQVLACAMSAPP